MARLSDIRGERVFDVLADIIDPCISIAMDDEASALFGREKCPEGEDPRKFIMRRIRKSVPPLMREHKGDLVAIMAAVEGADPEAYAEGLTMTGVIKGLYEMMTDEDLLAFLS